MGFTITKSVKFSRAIQGTNGLLLTLDSDTMDIELTYQVRNMDYQLVDGTCGVIFDITADNASLGGTLLFEFIYTGEGNVFDEAEKALKLSLA